ncbi:D-alanine--D-alanine ligase [Clostridiales bacterium COT073_COT-073]|nr:D-alanine--D-alanine ligase [Clostridiales bacterium COT073_COT-073]
MKTNIAVFFGGKATEHEVSVISAIQAMENMSKDKYNILPVYISKDEKFYFGPELREIERYKKLNELLKQVPEVALIKNSQTGKVEIYRLPLKLLPKKLAEFEVAFPILHGNKGENGSVQGMLEMLQIPYVGSGVGASAIGMDKVAAKRIARDIGLPVVDFVAFDKYRFFREEESCVTECETGLQYPMIVKPASGGSSIGVEVAGNREELVFKLAQVFLLDRKVIVENKIEAIREVNCSVLGDITEAHPSVIEEPITASEVLSFADKYMNDASKGMSSASRQIPADISEELKKQVEDYSLQIFREFGNAGVVRIDYIIDQASGKLYFNEINTIPGSLSFYLWKPLGKEYPAMLDELVKMAIQEHKRTAEIQYSFENNLFQSNSLGKMKGLKK